MSQKVIGIAFSALLFALCFSAEAQQPKKVPRVGYLSARPGGNVTGLSSLSRELVGCNA